MEKLMQSAKWLRIAAPLAALQSAGLSPAGLSAQLGPAPPSRVDLSEIKTYVARFTDANPIDCGQPALVRALVPATAKDLQQSLVCALAAAKERKAFWTFKLDQGTDSLLYQGLLGTVDGIVYQFWFDSAPCGRPGCAGRFSVSRCATPTVLVRRRGGADFGCDDLKQPLIPNP